MSNFQTAVFIVAIIIRSCDGSLSDADSEPLVGVKLTQTKENTEMKVVRPEQHYEYPGNNFVALGKINSEWNNYYACLIAEVEHEKERKPIIVQIMEGQFTSLKCSHCPRPFQENSNFEWRYKPLTSDLDDPEEPEVLDLAPQMKLTEKMNLKIYNAVAGYSGLYVCYHGNNPTSVYILEIIRDQPMSLLQSPPQMNKTTQVDDNTQLEVYYLWSKWTECSACETVGKQFRYGTCMVKPKDLLTQYNPSINQPVRREVRSRLRKTKKSQDSTMPQSESEFHVGKMILSRFRDGIPCSSTLLPIPYRPLIQELNKEGTAVLVEYCKIPCTESTIFEVIDKEGKIIEVANNTAGIYSSLQAIPKVPPEVERTTVTVKFGRDIVIQCPGSLNTDTPVTWMLDKQWLVPELISEESNGRMTIDLLNRLHIRRVRLKDSHVYSCWERDKLAGTVTLNVDKRMVLGYDHHTLLLGILSVSVGFIYVGIKVLAREIKMRKRLTT